MLLLSIGGIATLWDVYSYVPDPPSARGAANAPGAYAIARGLHIEAQETTTGRWKLGWWWLSCAALLALLTAVRLGRTARDRYAALADE